MAKSKKGFEKGVRKVKGKGAAAKKKAIHAMLEALINEDAETAAIHFHDYLQQKSREIVLGEEAEEKEEDEKDEDKEESDEDDNEDDEDEDDEKEEVKENAKPSAGLTKKQRSNVVKKAKAGKDLGSEGKDFKKVEKSAEKQYGSKEAGERVAAAQMWKKEAKKHAK